MTDTLTRAVRQAVIDRGWQPGSDLEDRAALFLSRARWQPADVTQQYRLGPYRIDFAWVESKLALEVDGFRHLHDPATTRKDAERDSRLRAQGWLVLRVDDSHGDESFQDQLARVSRLAYMLRNDR